MKTRLLAMLAGVAALLALSSCIESHQTLRLKKDGSGTIEEVTIMGAQMVAMMQMGAAQGGGAVDPFKDFYDEAKFKKKAASYGKGVSYVKFEKIDKDGGKGVKVIYAYKDVNKVRFEPGSGLDDVGPGAGGPGAGGGEEVATVDSLKFNYADGKLTIKFPEPPEGVEAPTEELPDANDEQTQQMMQMFKDMRVSAKLVVESGIATTNATHREGNTITLMDVNFSEVMQNPEGMKALQKLDMQDRKATEAALKDIKGVKIETKPTVEVTLK